MENNEILLGTGSSSRTITGGKIDYTWQVTSDTTWYEESKVSQATHEVKVTCTVQAVPDTGYELTDSIWQNNSFTKNFKNLPISWDGSPVDSIYNGKVTIPEDEIVDYILENVSFKESGGGPYEEGGPYYWEVDLDENKKGEFVVRVEGSYNIYNTGTSIEISKIYCNQTAGSLPEGSITYIPLVNAGNYIHVIINCSGTRLDLSNMRLYGNIWFKWNL